jgi:hypothetical protein
MDLIFNIHPNNLDIKKCIYSYNYNFLDSDFLINSNINYQNYYKILNTYDSFKLKNFYQFLYLRIIHINRKYKKIDILPQNNCFINCEELNSLLKNYIQNNILKQIIIMNAIQLYYNH